MPLWVLDTPAASGGNRELLTHGGRPLASRSAATVLDGEEPDDAPTSFPEDPIAALERVLSVPRTEREVCDELGLGPGLGRSLLRQGVAAGRLQREGKPFRYVVTSAAPQTRLFDAA